MTRQRSTWTEPKETSRQAATSRTADPYTMNQEHPQPGPTDYESGDPDSWAETPTTNKNVEAEYEGDKVKRNEVGFGEFRDDTWKHKDSDQWGGSGKYDNKTAAQRKSAAAERLARAILRTDNEKMILDQAVVLMGMPNKHLAATLRRMDQISPDALPKDAKYKRSLACCKVAARILPENTEEQYVEKLARAFMTLDDPTLRDMLKITAAADRAAAEARVAADGETDAEENSEPDTASEKKDDEDDPATASEKKDDEDGPVETEAGRKMRTPEGPPTGVEEGKEGEGEGKDAGCEACLCPDDSQMLTEMMQQEMGQPAPGPAGPAPELTELFEAPPAPAPVAPMPIASATPDITFDDDDESRTASADDGDLDSLFADDPEVQAQREIQASEQEQAARESGFGPEIRTASTGAKKLGQVQASKAPNQDENLENLWERP